METEETCWTWRCWRGGTRRVTLPRAPFCRRARRWGVAQALLPEPCEELSGQHITVVQQQHQQQQHEQQHVQSSARTVLQESAQVLCCSSCFKSPCPTHSWPAHVVREAAACLAEALGSPPL